MFSWTKTLWATHVWMTAFTTWFAGISPCQCVCPDGHRKLFCLGITCGTNGCCCGVCCDSARPHRESPTVQDTSVEATCPRCCCCRGTRGDNPSPAGKHNQMHRKGCRLQLAQAEIVTELRKTLSIDDFSVEISLLDAPARILPISTTCAFLQSYETYRPPLSPDLIVTLQHFVI